MACKSHAPNKCRSASLKLTRNVGAPLLSVRRKLGAHNVTWTLVVALLLTWEIIDSKTYAMIARWLY